MIAVLGIDPGMRFGMALVVDGTTIHTKSATSPNLAVDTTVCWVQYMQSNFQQCPLRLRIGSGSRLYSTLYLRELFRRNTKLAIELVNEQYTTRIGKSDQTSAIIIAGRWGKTLSKNPDLSLEPKGGYIKSLKQLVSQLTEGKRSLSTEEAHSILRDEKSIDYFISSEANQ
jgi:hypothetical protein